MESATGTEAERDTPERDIDRRRRMSHNWFRHLGTSHRVLAEVVQSPISFTDRLSFRASVLWPFEAMSPMCGDRADKSWGIRCEHCGRRFRGLRFGRCFECSFDEALTNRRLIAAVLRDAPSVERVKKKRRCKTKFIAKSKQLLQAIRLSPGKTRRELAEAISADPTKLLKMLGVFRAKNLVRNGAQRECTVRHALAKTWYAIPAGGSP